MTVDRAPVPPRVVPSAGLVESVVAAFSLPRPVHWLDLGGLWTTNLRFDYADGSAVVARAHRGLTPPERLLAIQSAKDAARRFRLPVPAAIPAPDGRGWSTLPDGTLVEVEEHIDWDTPMRTFAFLHKGFAALARLHDALRTLQTATPVASPPHATYLDPGQVVDGVCRGASRMRAWGEPRFSALADDVQRHCEAIADKEERLRHDQVRQLVHGDFWDDNVVFRGLQLAGVLDFDFLGERDRIEELALTLWFYLLEPGNNPPGDVQVQQVRGLVNTYDQSSALSLSDAERERLPLALARQPAWIAGGWLPALADAGARAQAADLAARLPTAEAILDDLTTWTSALAR
ncbi:phosphotransferase [Oryzihumus leptocrescens]|uniref:Homoserine kinase type II n=1 Tax=Oryzihumus leptocrescens TaxID=297536 RepID=A0A542ZH81_9MICO|nr:phosphotransferase [Oryzihumus leptocrescens]TQL59666.1 homoserine kinase type II [Oryzihumus leptocrescens]